MKMMKALLAGCVFVCVFPCGVCFSRGASVSSCVNMKPGHISSFPQHTRTHSAVSVRTSRSVYLPQHTLTVTVQSPRPFMGFLLQARSVLQDQLIDGEFTLHPPSTHTLSCISAQDSVTHSDKSLKRNLSFSWRAPAQPRGDLRFYITLVQSYFVYWSRIRSAVVHDGTHTSQITDSVPGQPALNSAASMLEQTSKHTSMSTHTTTSTHTNTYEIYNTNPNTHTTPAFNKHINTQSLNTTQTPASSYTHTSAQTVPVTASQRIYSSANTKINTNTHKLSSVHTQTTDINIHTPDNTHKTTANNTHTAPNLLLETHRIHTSIQQTHTYTPSVHTHTTERHIHTLDNAYKTTAKNTHTTLNLLLQTQSINTHSSTHMENQQTYTSTPSVNTHGTDINTHKNTTYNTHSATNLFLQTQSINTHSSIHTTKQETHTQSTDINTQKPNKPKNSSSITHSALNLLLQTDRINRRSSTHTTMQQTHTIAPSIHTHNTDINTHIPNNTNTTYNTHSALNLHLQTHSIHTHSSTHTTKQQTHTSTPSAHPHTHFFSASLHPDPSPALRRSLSDFSPSREPTEGAISLSQRKIHPSNEHREVPVPPKQPKVPSGAPEGGGPRPERVPSRSALELGILLSLSAALGMAVAVGLRFLQRKHCRKRTAVSLNDRNHDNRGIIHVQECGDLVQVRKIRQNSFLVLEAQYNLITPAGD